MAMTPRDMKVLREAFKGAPGREMPEVSISGDDLEIVLSPTDNSTGIIIPYDEEGHSIYLVVNNSVLKRWRGECQEAVRIMRRVATGERNTEYRNMSGHALGKILG
jgi:hypothetical protein